MVLKALYHTPPDEPVKCDHVYGTETELKSSLIAIPLTENVIGMFNLFLRLNSLDIFISSLQAIEHVHCTDKRSILLL